MVASRSKGGAKPQPDAVVNSGSARPLGTHVGTPMDHFGTRGLPRLRLHTGEGRAPGSPQPTGLGHGPCSVVDVGQDGDVNHASDRALHRSKAVMLIHNVQIEDVMKEP